MKTALKIILTLLVGLSAAVIVYPFLHESGHSLAALIVGGRVVEYHLLPMPYILCDVRNISVMGQCFIGIGGILLPMAVTTVFHPKKQFWAWYGNLMLRGICVLSVAITAVASFLYAAGNPVVNEDITTVLNIVPNSVATVIIASLLNLAFLIILIARDKPVRKICDYMLD